jgi:hypothetical protein
MEACYLPSSSHNTQYHTWTASQTTYMSLCNSNALIIDIGFWITPGTNGYHAIVQYGYTSPSGATGINVSYMETYTGKYELVHWPGSGNFRYYMDSTNPKSLAESKYQIINYY